MASESSLGHSAEDVKGHFVLKEIIYSFVTPFMLKAIVLLDIPKILSKGPLSLVQIESQLPDAKDPQPKVLQRVLNYLVHKDLLSESTDANGDVVYGLNSISKWLVDEAPYLLACTHPYLQGAFQKIHEAVLEECHPHERTHGTHVWDHPDPEFITLLNEAMLNWSGLTMGLILENYDGFKDAKTLVDAGGGLGMCLEMITKKYPHIQGVNLEIPSTAAIAPPIPGVTHVGGDMFSSIPPCDTVMIKSAFINFGDEACQKLLNNAYNALSSGGKIILIEVLHTKDGTFENLLDMVMLGVCSGGRTRSEEEFKEMLGKAGFSRFNIQKMPSKEQIIEAYKA